MFWRKLRIIYFCFSFLAGMLYFVTVFGLDANIENVHTVMIHIRSKIIIQTLSIIIKLIPTKIFRNKISVSLKL